MERIDEYRKLARARVLEFRLEYKAQMRGPIRQNVFICPNAIMPAIEQLPGGEYKVSKKKGAKGMPKDGPGKHNPTNPQKDKSEVPVYDKPKSIVKNERPRKTRV